MTDTILEVLAAVLIGVALALVLYVGAWQFVGWIVKEDHE